MSATEATSADPEPTPEEGPGDGGADRGKDWDRSFFGHPHGLLTLFGTEMWERFSYLGMTAILTLFFTASAAEGGLGMSDGAASSVYAAYSTMIYLVSVAGGWLADRILGAYRSVLYGGVCIALGHYAMAVPATAMTWVGLGLIIIGTGLLKPNVSTLVGKLYATEDERRDAGFALYYMGINIGAFLGPLISGWLGQKIGYHWGFSAAAVGMTFGIVQYVLGRRHLAGRQDGAESAVAPEVLHRSVRLIGYGAAAVAALFAVLALTGVLDLDLTVDIISAVSVLAPIGYFAFLFRSPQVTAEERGRLRPYLVLFGASVAFNLVLFQSYSTMNLLALNHADTNFWGWEFPSSWYGSVLGVAEVVLAPVVAATWIRLGSRQPHASNKIAYGVVLGGLSFLIMVPATLGRTGDWTMSGVWLILCYLVLGLGDILLETTGMSATTKLAPAAFSSQAMALWFLSLALANGLQAQVVKLYGVLSYPLYFGLNGAFVVLVGLAVIAAGPWLRRTMAPVH
ncbi:peptide MFS transporter [Streptacidiphilus albus]|uniref:peptide MFS transporter n=1 Tax=Streptacidiphilus albus TaxID=105425 RepID=UPI0009DF4B56|nr:peptide MFS transporter [Streptacidiphilus albus]